MPPYYNTRSREQARQANADAPVYTLPVEMISKIFLHTLDLPSHDAGRPAPTLIVQVCHDWRNIALDLAPLWCSLHLSLDMYTNKRRASEADSLMGRSGSLPLCITLHPTTSRNYDLLFSNRVRELQQFLIHLHPHLLRLERLDMGVTMTVSNVQRLMRHTMPILTHLTLWMNRLLLLPPWTNLSPQTAPCLRTLELHHYNSHSDLRLPLQQITTLLLHHIKLHNLYAILRETPALQHCEVSQMEGGPSDQQQPIQLSHLKALIFSRYKRDENRDPPHWFLPISAMIFPTLQILQIPEAYLVWPAFNDLGALLSRSGCNLQELRIIDLTWTAEVSYKRRFATIPSLSFPRQLSY
ncbi:hypothetical protein C8R43DRAFT_950559 [Mycena crocata]|nr:hypothetical protein C8R43DRAFT_950559 [Mycena crocata]